MSKRTSILAVYEKFEKLVARLPMPLQKPILAELDPVKKLFLLQRAPRIVLIGERAADKAQLLNALFDAEVLHADEAAERSAGWEEITRPGHGTIHLLDARLPATTAGVKRALTAEAPDVFLFLRSPVKSDADADIERGAEILHWSDQQQEVRPAVLGVIVRTGSADAEPARKKLNAELMAHPSFDNRLTATMAVFGFETKSDGRKSVERFALALAEKLPLESRLDFARLCAVRPVQAQIAQTLVRSVTAMCTAIGTQPIPIADFPVLTTLQVMLVAGVGYISGREMSTKLAGQFLAAVGANIGAGLVLREGARALLKFLPLWGNAISGAVAGAGTYAIGRAAIGHFVEGISLTDARQLFRLSKPKRRELRSAQT